ncbi:hypothetical protein HDU96_002004 [Phlyctochytrium bullatum]|nr:hypothetical protein HDU96_002004 [Phlyctochytrium bullatum]
MSTAKDEMASSAASTTGSSSSWSAQLRQWLWIPTRTIMEAGITFISRTLSSDHTQRSALGLIVFTVLLLGLLSISSMTYAVFYWLYIPRVTHLVPMFLQYPSPFTTASDPNGLHVPTAVADIGQKIEVNSGLKAEQHYNLGLQLWMPNSDENFNLGNFMISMELLSATNKTLATTLRPAIMRYQSPLLRTISTVVSSFPLVLGTSYEAQVLNIPLIEDFIELKESPARYAIIKLSSPRIQVYESFITVEAHFQGLRYFMYHWGAVTAAVFISFFMFWYSMVGLVLWRMFVSWFRRASKNMSKQQSTLGPQELWKQKAEELMQELDADPHVQSYASEDSSDDDDQKPVAKGASNDDGYGSPAGFAEPPAMDDPVQALGHILGHKQVDPLIIPGPSAVSPTSPVSPEAFTLLSSSNKSPDPSYSPQFASLPPNASAAVPSYIPGLVPAPPTGSTPASPSFGQRDVFDEDRSFIATNK